jgi:hypothetical protein
MIVARMEARDARRNPGWSVPLRVIILFAAIGKKLSLAGAPVLR